MLRHFNTSGGTFYIYLSVALTDISLLAEARSSSKGAETCPFPPTVKDIYDFQ